jgi:predicted nucleic acid-binding protein
MELITGVERRRRWRPDEKLRILRVRSHYLMVHVDEQAGRMAGERRRRFLTQAGSPATAVSDR